MGRKILKKFPSLLEAEAAINFLESFGIKSAHIDNKNISSIMPHASSAFGGFIVSVDSLDHGQALAYLKEANEQQIAPELVGEITEQTTLHSRTMKRATYGAVLGFFLLPMIANIFSTIIYVSVYKKDHQVFWSHPYLITIGAFFNILSFIIYPAILLLNYL
ncbi:MAG: hypothetical protein M9962_09610 [Oligoflexia bacterium]|nr:hypothetical protein [Oligoflexia bacterium]